MNKELTEELVKKYPKILAGKYGGIGVGDGWYVILDALLNLIQQRIDFSIEHGAAKKQVTATRIKEKFGMLRFYTSNSDDYIDGAITMAELMSGRICEECGKPGIRGGSSWIKTLCEEHRAKNS